MMRGAGATARCLQALHSVPERELLELLDERNRVAANLATEAHKTRGTGVNDQVWSAAVHVEWTPADERGAGTTKPSSCACGQRGDLHELGHTTDHLGVGIQDRSERRSMRPGRRSAEVLDPGNLRLRRRAGS